MKPSCLTSVSPRAQWGRRAQRSSLLFQPLHQALGIWNLLPLEFNAGRCTAHLGADGVQCLILCSLFVLCSSLKQQVARILELAREKQAAELRVLRDTSER